MKLKELERIRKSRGYSLRYLSKKMGISTAYLCQIENGKRKLSYRNAFLISHFFGMKPDDIFYQDFLRGELEYEK